MSKQQNDRYIYPEIKVTEEKPVMVFQSSRKPVAPPKEIHPQTQKVPQYKIEIFVDRMIQSSVKKQGEPSNSKLNNSIKSFRLENPSMNDEQVDIDLPVYNRLYSQSIGESDSQTFRNRITKPNSFVIPSLCVDESENIVQIKLCEHIDEIVGKKQTLSTDELASIFTQLGILEPQEKIEEISVLQPKIEKWRVENNFYDALLVKKDLITALTSKKGKFNYFARQRMNIFFANTKKKSNIKQDKNGNTVGNQSINDDNSDAQIEENPKPKSHLSQKTLTRLLESPKRNENNEEEEKIEVFQKTPLSEETQKILLQSPIGQLPFEERDEKLRKKVQKQTNKLAKEIDQERIGIRKKPVQIELTPEMREKVDELRRKQKEPLPQPSYHSF